MNTVIILAMHGSPPNDFPKSELAEFFGLHSRLEFSVGPVVDEIRNRYIELDNKLRSWPRTAKNDPFYVASNELGAHLESKTGLPVFVGFNEFCNPELEDSFNNTITTGAEKIIVITPMMTPGGEHSELEIPKIINKVQSAHPKIQIQYAWPFDLNEVAQFLAAQISKLTN